MKCPRLWRQAGLACEQIQRPFTALNDHGEGSALPTTLWDSLPAVAVVGGQVSSFPPYICFYL